MGGETSAAYITDRLKPPGHKINAVTYKVDDEQDRTDAVVFLKALWSKPCDERKTMDLQLQPVPPGGAPGPAAACAPPPSSADDKNKNDARHAAPNHANLITKALRAAPRHGSAKVRCAAPRRTAPASQPARESSSATRQRKGKEPEESTIFNRLGSGF